jgi:hypothetical protein
MCVDFLLGLDHDLGRLKERRDPYPANQIISGGVLIALKPIVWNRVYPCDPWIQERCHFDRSSHVNA